MMRTTRIFSGSIVYVAWLLMSCVILFISWSIDPYVYGFAAYGTMFISIGLFVVSLFFGIRPILLAALAALPTAISFAILSTYRWA